MRRKDREMDKEFALNLIDRSDYGVVSLVDKDNLPYAIPLSLVREGNFIYFHSALSGEKVDLLDLERRVSIVFVGQVKVPDLYSREELINLSKDEKNANLLVSTVFTTEFESAIVMGRVSKIKDESDKIRILKLICQKYTPDKMLLFDIGAQSGVDKVNIYRIEIEEITGKRKKFDSLGKEMKWMRKE